MRDVRIVYWFRKYKVQLPITIQARLQLGPIAYRRCRSQGMP